jgi:hypothetical protein
VELVAISIISSGSHFEPQKRDKKGIKKGKKKEIRKGSKRANERTEDSTVEADSAPDQFFFFPTSSRNEPPLPCFESGRLRRRRKRRKRVKK